MKGNADTKIYTGKGRDNYDQIVWGSDKKKTKERAIK